MNAILRTAKTADDWFGHGVSGGFPAAGREKRDRSDSLGPRGALPRVFKNILHKAMLDYDCQTEDEWKDERGGSRA